MTQATGSSFFTQAMALATANTSSTTLPELIAFMGSRLGQTRANQLLAKVGHLLTLEQQYTLHETYLYGSSRLGVKNQQLNLSTRVASVQNGSLTPIGNAILNTDSVFTGTASAYNLPKAPSSRVFYRTWGLKQYELSNHLGNVQVTISDKKLGVLSSNQEDFIAYEPEVKSATDYYAYGMEMPGKTYQSTSYRYGMNTQEKDNEIYGPGNTLGALYWEYDARTARRWNVDPVVKEYEGGYTAFSGNPIWFVDVEGNDTSFVNANGDTYDVKKGGADIVIKESVKAVTVVAEKTEQPQGVISKWLDRIQVGLDIAGIADPTPICDVCNGVIYGLRGRFGDAGISLAGTIPLFGDALKTKRLGKAGKEAIEAINNQVGKSVNQLNKAVKTGNAPRGIKRFDKGKGTKNLPQDEVHFDNGSSLYRDGTWRHDKGHKLTNEQIEFLKENGWNLPK